MKKKSIWRSMLSSKMVLFSCLFLLLAFFISVFAMIIIPDRSANANYQQLELALKPPGYQIDLLQVKRDKVIKVPSLFSQIIHGKETRYEEIPIQEAKIVGDEVLITGATGSDKILPLDRVVLNARGSKVLLNKRRYILGSDKFGRDILSRLILGIRLSLFIGLMAVVLSLVIGISIGASGAYFGGRIDVIVMYLINITWSVPTLLLVFSIVLAFGRGVEVVFIAIALTLWVDVARIVRGQVLKIKSEEYIIAAKSLSYHPARIISKHILPNIIGPLLVVAATNFAVAILIEAGLSYLGFGIQPPTPSIGNMLHENYGYAISGKAFLALVPAITIMLLVLAFNLVGSGLRDILDVRRID